MPPEPLVSKATVHADCDPETCVHRWVFVTLPGGEGGYLVPLSYAIASAELPEVRAPERPIPPETDGDR